MEDKILLNSTELTGILVKMKFKNYLVLLKKKIGEEYRR